MFIANKTINVLKTMALVVLSALVVVIAGQSVLYIKLVNENKTALSTMQTKIDSAKAFDTISLTKQTTTDKTLKQTQAEVDSLQAAIQQLQVSVDGLLFNTKLLINNECQVTPYYMDKSLLEMCKKQ